MGGIKDWAPYQTMVQGGLMPGDHASGVFVMIAAGPPSLAALGGPSALGGSADVVYPIGLTQNLAMGSNKQFSRIFELGSDRSIFIPGRSVGQVTLSRIYYHGPSLLRSLWAYYTDAGGQFPEIESLWDTNFTALDYPYINGPSEGGLPKRSPRLHDVKIPPGFGNVFMNLASDLFNNPIGLLLLLRSSEEATLSAGYLEQCVVPNHNWAVDAQGVVIQESVGIQYERYTPLRANQIETLRGLIPGPNPTQLTQLQQAQI